MASDRKIAANRQNALMSTGPKTESGKLRSRKNAVRHGLTAETVVPDLEDAEQYSAFESAIVAEYDPKSIVARELVFRLASLLWRLRRATAIEAALLAIQAEIHRERRMVRDRDVQARERRHTVIRNLLNTTLDHETEASTAAIKQEDTNHSDGASVCNRLSEPHRSTTFQSRNLAQCFLRLANLDERMLDRIGYYELRLWRQAAQTIFILETLKRARGV
jgi:hypothetical protein